MHAEFGPCADGPHSEDAGGLKRREPQKRKLARPDLLLLINRRAQLECPNRSSENFVRA